MKEHKLPVDCFLNLVYTYKRSIKTLWVLFLVTAPPGDGGWSPFDTTKHALLTP